jgi:predicted RNA binding protein YcfA (HicA-like mRNA interferase family)
VAKTKRTDLIRILEKNGWYKVREGGNHTVYTNGEKIEAVPRHKEIAEILAKAIIKRQKLK